MKKATQTADTRNAYRKLAAARTAGKLLANVGTNADTRKAIADIRAEARLDLELGGHYPDRLDAAGTWKAENRHGEPFQISNDGEWVEEALTFYLHNDLDDFVVFEYIATYHIGHEQDNSLDFKRSTYALDEHDNKLGLISVHAYKTARRYADTLARQAFIERSASEYGRVSLFSNGESDWYYRPDIYQENGGYRVEVYDDASGSGLITVWFNYDGAVAEAQDNDGESITLTEKEEDFCREAVMNRLVEQLEDFRRHQ